MTKNVDRQTDGQTAFQLYIVDSFQLDVKELDGSQSNVISLVLISLCFQQINMSVVQIVAILKD